RRAVCAMAITPDAIDVTEATARGIPVTVVPPIVGEATADINFGLMIAVARRMWEGDRLLRKGGFPGGQSNHLAASAVSGKVLGLIGGGGRPAPRGPQRAQRACAERACWGAGPAPGRAPRRIGSSSAPRAEP